MFWQTEEIAKLIAELAGRVVSVEVDALSGYTVTAELVDIVYRGPRDGGADDLLTIRFTLPGSATVYTESNRIADLGAIDGRMPAPAPMC